MLGAFVKRFARDQRGATAIEYAIMSSLLGVIIIGSVIASGDSLRDMFQEVADGMNRDD